MLFFPKSSDTRDIKTLINRRIFMYDGKKGNLRSVLTCDRGSKVRGRSYEWDYDYSRFEFDKEYIYQNGEPIALAELLVNKIIHKEYLDDSVLEILDRNGLDIEPISIGTSNALFYEGESFDSVERVDPAYVIIKK